MKWKAEWVCSAVYLLAAACFIANGPGLQYDEALLAHGAVHMLYGHGPPPFAHETASWIAIGSAWLPLMVISYVGAVKDYLLLPLFGIAGVSTAVVRSASVVMSAAVIWGGARALRRHAGNTAALAYGCALAIHPSFVAHTTFDNGSVAQWMLPLGLVVIAIDEYARRRDRMRAFWLGAACGLAIWCRANCAWFLIAFAIAAIVVYRDIVWQSLRDAGIAIAGGLAGAAPFLLFQFATRGAILRFLRASRLASLPLAARLEAFGDVLVSSEEKRVIWGGAAPAMWQTIVLAAIAVIALAVIVSAKDKFQRFVGIAAIVVSALMLFSRTPVTEHHLAGVLPFLIAATALALARNRIAAICAAAAYVFIVALQITDATAGLRRTGGIGVWSDAINRIANDREVIEGPAGILDWGLYNNLYVLTRARIRGRELFWGSDTRFSGSGLSWGAEIAHGGNYLMPATVVFPNASAGFMAALVRSRQRYTVRTFVERSGRPYAIVYTVHPRVIPSAEEREESPAPEGESPGAR